MAVEDVRSDGVGEKPPPSNPQAEQALLGALLCNNKAFNAVSGFLRPEHFADPVHGFLFQSISRHIEAGRSVDPILLKNELENTNVLRDVGGTIYLVQLVSAMVGITLAADYGRVIHDTWVRRQLIDVAEMIKLNAYGIGSDLSGQDQISLLADEVVALESATATVASKPVGNTTLWDAFNAAVDRAEGMARGSVARPYSTGLPCIDRMMAGGVSPDTMSFMVGAGGAGKTELALQIAETVALNAYLRWLDAGKQGPCPGVLYIMLGNMTATQIGARTAARYAAMRLAPIRRGTLDTDQGERLIKAGETVAQIPVELSDTGPSTVARVLGDIRRFAKRRPLVLTIVDNLSDLLSVAGDKMFSTAIGATKMLKEQGATATKSAVLLLMHLNSGVENRKDRSAKPRSGDIPWGTKKDADNAFGVWRPVKYLDGKPERPAKKLSAEGEDLYLKWLREWENKRQPWPVGIADITEVVPLKLREEDDDRAGEIGRLRFERDRHRFIDVETETNSAEADDGVL